LPNDERWGEGVPKEGIIDALLPPRTANTVPKVANVGLRIERSFEL